MENIEQIIMGFVQELSDSGDDSDLTGSVNLFDAGYLDSLGAIQLISLIEERFHIKISEKDILKYNMNTIEEIVQVVADKTGK